MTMRYTKCENGRITNKTEKKFWIGIFFFFSKLNFWIIRVCLKLVRERDGEESKANKRNEFWLIVGEQRKKIEKEFRFSFIYSSLMWSCILMTTTIQDSVFSRFYDSMRNISWILFVVWKFFCFRSSYSRFIDIIRVFLFFFSFSHNVFFLYSKQTKNKLEFWILIHSKTTTMIMSKITMIMKITKMMMIMMMNTLTLLLLFQCFIL